MNTKSDDGGQVFPSVKCQGTCSENITLGITLRDQFVMTLLHKLRYEVYESADPQDIAERVYKIADALIAVRNKE